LRNIIIDIDLCHCKIEATLMIFEFKVLFKKL